MQSKPVGGPVSLDLVNTVLAARRFYLDGASKSDIADDLGISRFKVTRLLEAAKRDGIVRITIDVPAEVDLERWAALRASLPRKVTLAHPVTGRPETVEMSAPPRPRECLLYTMRHLRKDCLARYQGAGLRVHG